MAKIITLGPQKPIVTPDEHELMAQFTADFRKHIQESKRPLTVVMTPLQAWAMIAQIQYAEYFPAQGAAPTAAIAKRIALALQEAISFTPAIRAVCDQAWLHNQGEPKKANGAGEPVSVAPDHLADAGPTTDKIADAGPTTDKIADDAKEDPTKPAG